MAISISEGPFTLSDSDSENEKDQRTIRKHQRKFSLSLTLSLSVNGPFGSSLRPCINQWVTFYSVNDVFSLRLVTRTQED